MKLTVLLFSIMACTTAAFAQGPTGLVAHWPFTGNANDVSGNAIHGTASGAVLAPGYSAIANTAYSFRGYNSGTAEYEHINVPYDAKMNVQHFSVCTLVKVDSFWPGLCTVSSLLWRGTQGTNDHYSLSLNDNVNDNDCYAFSPATTNYVGEVGDLAWGVAPLDRGYPDYAVTNTWTCVVETFDGDSMKIYMDGILRNSIYYPYSLTPGIEGLRIGASTFDITASGTHPYPFFGSIDDMKLYDHALTPLEVDMYCEEAKGTGGGDPGGEDTTDNPTPTSFSSVAKTFEFNVAPNPASNYVQVLVAGKATGKAQLLNSMGQLVAEQTIDGSYVQFDMRSHAPGAYMIRVQAANGSIGIRKFVKQ